MGREGDRDDRDGWDAGRAHPEEKGGSAAAQEAGEKEDEAETEKWRLKRKRGEG